MIDQDKTRFATLMFGVAEYYGKKTSKGVVKLYWESLKVHEYEDVNRAVTRHMEDPDAGQFMPKISDIKRHIEGSKQTQAMTAWTKVDRAIRRCGPWNSICFDDPIINRVIAEMGGWIALCDTPTEKDLEFRMHEFNKRYQSYVLQGGVTDYPKKLIGHTEAHNNKLGQENHDVLLLGNEQKALAVFERGQQGLRLEAKKASEVSLKLIANQKQDEGAA